MTNNGVAQKFYIGVMIALAVAVVCGWITITGDVRANTTSLVHFSRRADKTDAIIEGQAKNLSSIKADVQEIKAILTRMESR